MAFFRIFQDLIEFLGFKVDFIEYFKDFSGFCQDLIEFLGFFSGFDGFFGIFPVHD